MRKIIKSIVVIAIVGVFVFSSNPAIEKAREFTLEKGGELYEKVIQKGDEYAEKNGKENLQKGIKAIK